MLKLCLTGSIATGKSTVSNYMKELGAVIIDTDLIVHDIYKYPSSTCDSILKTFGVEYLTEGKIDRKKLSEKVFKNKDDLNKLNAIVHPAVRLEVEKQVNNYIDLESKLNKNYLVVFVIPLFYETNSSYQVDYVIVSACSEEKQLERLIKRDSFSLEEANKRINAQLSISEKIKKADYVIDTNENKEKIMDQVRNLLYKWKWDSVL